MKRKLFRKSDIPILFIVLAVMLAAVFLINNKQSGSGYVITQNGVEIASGSLDENTELVLSGVTFRVENGEIAIVETDCASRLCEKTGGISSGSSSIVCLPKKIVVSITDSENSEDVIVG